MTSDAYSNRNLKLKQIYNNNHKHFFFTFFIRLFNELGDLLWINMGVLKYKNVYYSTNTM